MIILSRNTCLDITVIKFPPAKNTPAFGFERVDIFMDYTGVPVAVFVQTKPSTDAFNVVDKTTVFCGESNHSNGKVFGNRHIDHGTDIPAVFVSGGSSRCLHCHINTGFESAGVRFVGDDADRTRLSTGAIETALRSGKSFDTIDINQANINLHSGLSNRLLIDVRSDRFF